MRKAKNGIAIAILSVIFGVSCLGHLLGHVRSRVTAESGGEWEPMKHHARGTFEVKMTTLKPDSAEAESMNLGRMSGDKKLHGDLEGTGKGEMLSFMSQVEGSGGYVAIERITGKLAGRSGSFMLLHSGVMTKGVPQLWSVTVIPDSGTEQLKGIAGAMAIEIKEGKHFYDFEYTLPED